MAQMLLVTAILSCAAASSPHLDDAAIMVQTELQKQKQIDNFATFLENFIHEKELHYDERDYPAPASVVQTSLKETKHIEQHTQNSTSLSGEAACEGRSLSKADCKAVGCCKWNKKSNGGKGKCFSNVGEKQCKKPEGEKAAPVSVAQKKNVEKAKPKASSKTNAVVDVKRLSGEAACEGQSLSKTACNAVGCCKWNKKSNGGKGKCFSNVGEKKCKKSNIAGAKSPPLSAAQKKNVEKAKRSVARKKNVKKEKKNVKKGKMNVEKAKRTSKSLTGEAACEGRSLSKKACKAVGCCRFKEGKCWSNVGNKQCKR